MSQNLVVAGTIYHGVDSISMTNESGRKVIYIEKVNCGTGIPVAQIGLRTFDTLEDALAGAVSGETVKLIADTTENINIIVTEGVTLDLNGKMLTCDGITTFNGQVMDSASEVGGVKVNKGYALFNGNAYLPLFDVDNNCYRFFDFKVRGVAAKQSGDAVTFGFTFDFVNLSGYSIVADHGFETGFGEIMLIDWETANRNYEHSEAHVKQVMTTQRNNVIAGNGKNAVLTYKLTGLSSIPGKTITNKLTVTSHGAKMSDTLYYDVPSA